jgi:hypothetical protein
MKSTQSRPFTPMLLRMLQKVLLLHVLLCSWRAWCSCAALLSRACCTHAAHAQQSLEYLTHATRSPLPATVPAVSVFFQVTMRAILSIVLPAALLVLLLSLLVGSTGAAAVAATSSKRCRLDPSRVTRDAPGKLVFRPPEGCRKPTNPHKRANREFKVRNLGISQGSSGRVF